MVFSTLKHTLSFKSWFLLLQFSVLFTVESLYLFVFPFYVLVYDESIWSGSFMQTSLLCVLVHILNKGKVGAQWNRFKHSSKKILLTVPRRCFFWGSSMLFLSCFCYAFVCVCLLVPCGHQLEKCWPLGSRLWCLIVKLSLSYWYPGSGVVLDFIDSWSLSFFFQ